MIARPARVRIRSRKPWVLDRRRLFGWNVRLLTRYSHYTTSKVCTRRWVGTRDMDGRRGEPVPRPRTSTSIAGNADGPVSRPDADFPGSTIGSHPWTPTRRGTPATRPGGAPGMPVGLVAGLWTGLLASPSLHTGHRRPAQ